MRSMIQLWILLFSLLFHTQQSSSTRSKAMNSLSQCLQMPKTTNHPRQILKYILQNNLITVGPALPTAMPTRIVRRSLPQETHCPFTFEEDEKGNRIPRTLVYAVCKTKKCKSPLACQPVFYSQMVLEKKCDGVWEMKQKRLPVAYVGVY
ncbi:hypothetical protein AC249_AIPGENE16566 [Exaiptasia diaphana]|nr:hypothetical protein AC249_AIPGENE16566 [Exaiptasia diaphana]